MHAKYITVVADSQTARKIREVITRLAGAHVQIFQPGGLKRIAHRITESQPDAVVYSWTGDEMGILRWLKDKHMSIRDVRFTILAYKGFSMEDAFTINRTIGWGEDDAPVAYAA